MPHRLIPKKSKTKVPRVAFYVYPTAFQHPGGGEVQLLKTKEALETLLGTQVRLFDQWSDNFSDFDILHTFGSVKDCLNMILDAREKGVKNALSTICWYSWKSAVHTYGSWTDAGASLLRQFAKSYFPFLPSKRKSMMDHSDILFPNSQTEADQLVRYFCVPREKIFVVPNGVDPIFANAGPDAFVEKYGLKDFILCVGRIEPRKNQLNMIRALKGCKIPLVIIGDYVDQYRKYYEACRLEAGDGVYFLGSIPHDSEILRAAYAACNTFLLPSWLETPGLAALEAALAGAKVVITDQGATREYFSAFATYVTPDNLSNIRNKTLKTFEKPKSTQLKAHIQNNFLWENAAKKTLEGYELILKQ